jgi:hypothetical protein
MKLEAVRTRLRGCSEAAASDPGAGDQVMKCLSQRGWSRSRRAWSLPSRIEAQIRRPTYASTGTTIRIIATTNAAMLAGYPARDERNPVV